MDDLIWFQTEDEVMARLPHYRYTDPSQTDEVRGYKARIVYVTNRVFPTLMRGDSRDVYLIVPVSEMSQDQITARGLMMGHFNSRTRELKNAGLDPQCGSWSVNLRHLTLVVPAHA